MSRKLRLGMRRKINSLIVREGIPAIWFIVNPNDISNPVKLRLAAYRTRDPEEVEAFLTNLEVSSQRMRLAISDPLSSSSLFHREMSIFFKYYVKVGKPCVFGRINLYFGAVKMNERGALHLHRLLWIKRNMCLSSLWGGVEDEMATFAGSRRPPPPSSYIWCHCVWRSTYIIYIATPPAEFFVASSPSFTSSDTCLIRHLDDCCFLTHHP